MAGPSSSPTPLLTPKKTLKGGEKGEGELSVGVKHSQLTLWRSGARARAGEREGRREGGAVSLL